MASKANYSSAASHKNQSKVFDDNAYYYDQRRGKAHSLRSLSDPHSCAKLRGKKYELTPLSTVHRVHTRCNSLLDSPLPKDHDAAGPSASRRKVLAKYDIEDVRHMVLSSANVNQRSLRRVGSVADIDKISPEKLKPFLSFDKRKSTRRWKMFFIITSIVLLVSAVFTFGGSIALFSIGTISVFSFLSFLQTALSIGWFGVQFYKKYLRKALKLNPGHISIMHQVGHKWDQFLDKHRHLNVQLQRFFAKHPAGLRTIIQIMCGISFVLSLATLSGLAVGIIRGVLAPSEIVNLIEAFVTTVWISMQALKKIWKSNAREKKIHHRLDAPHGKIEKFEYTHPSYTRITLYVLGIIAFALCCITMPGIAISIAHGWIDDAIIYGINGIFAIWQGTTAYLKYKKYQKVWKKEVVKDFTDSPPPKSQRWWSYSPVSASCCRAPLSSPYRLLTFESPQ
jgi:hypothetical protein